MTQLPQRLRLDSYECARGSPRSPPSLPDGTALAFTAWNKLLTCPAKITADQAATVAQGFIDSFACTNNAPEGKLGDGC